MLIEASLLVLLVAVTSFVTRHFTIKEFDSFLFNSKRCGDYSVRRKLFFYKWLSVLLILLVIFVARGTM